MAPGTYYFKETSYPTAYLQEPSVVSKTLKADEHVTVEFPNRYKIAYVSLQKSPSKDFYAHPENYSLAGAKYWLYNTEASAKTALQAVKSGSSVPTDGRVKDENGKDIVLITNESGKTQTEKVFIGNYWAVEFEASKNYMLDDIAPIKVKETNQMDNPAVIKSTEVPYPGYAKLIKDHDKPHYSHPENYSLIGAEYTVYLDEGCSRPAKDYDGKDAVLITKDEDGNTNVLKLEVGDYWVKETKESLCHYLDEKTYKLTVTKDNITDQNH